MNYGYYDKYSFSEEVLFLFFNYILKFRVNFEIIVLNFIINKDILNYYFN